MYAKFFGLAQEPFSIAPDPRYLFMSERHREALAHLLYGVKGGGGFVLLTGEVGAGKTTVCRCFLEQIPKRCNVAYVFNPKLTVAELLRSVCDEFHIPLDDLPASVATVKDYTDRLNEFLLRTHAVGQINVLIIDEAQALSADVLEQLRLLTNLETNERKLLQIVLIGQPELRKLLARPDLEQVSQRVIARYHLKALSESETDQYVRHRLGVAGMTRPVPFERDALRRIHQLSRGIPRRINLLCDRALLGAYSAGQDRIGREVIDKAADEVFERGLAEPRPERRRGPGRNTWLAIGAGGGVLAGALIATLVVQAMQGADAPGAGATAALASASAAAPQPAGGASGTDPTGAGPGATPATTTADGAPAAAADTTGTRPADDGAPAAGRPPDGAPATRPAASAVDAAGATPEAAAPLRGLPTALLDEAQAWRQLATAWRLDGLEAGDPCAAAERRQLLCFRGEGLSDLRLLRRLDRPAWLTLSDGRGGAGQVVLTALAPDGATLRAGDALHRVPLDVLQSRWRGDFATLWHAPPGVRADVVDAASGGESARWVAARLDRLPGGAATAGRPLRERVRAFQRAEGLVADGLAGPITLMQLNRASGVDEPRLVVAAAGAAPAQKER